MKPRISYPNWQSRILMGPAFRRQTVIPEPPPKVIERLLSRYEQRRLKVDTSSVLLEKPIFIVGLPRSGTSMLQDILAAHPSAAYFTNSMTFFRSCFCAAEHFRKRFKLDVSGERYLADSVRVSASSPSEAVAFWGEWFDVNPYSLAYVDYAANPLSDEKVERIRDTIRKVIWCFGGTSPRFLCKLLGMFPHLGLIQRLFPDARFVHIIRDARMTANSMLKLYRRERENQIRLHGWTKESVDESRIFVPYPRFPRLEEYAETYGLSDIRTTAHLWNDAIHYASETRQHLAHFYEVRYEDICAEPTAEVGKILEFCEVPEPEKSHRPFWDQIDGVGKVHHVNRYDEFDVVEDVCRENLLRYRYLQPS